MEHKKFCPQCGSECSPQSRFCSACGTQIEPSLSAPSNSTSYSETESPIEGVPEPARPVRSSGSSWLGGLFTATSPDDRKKLVSSVLLMILMIISVVSLIWFVSDINIIQEIEGILYGKPTDADVEDALYHALACQIIPGGPIGACFGELEDFEVLGKEKCGLMRGDGLNNISQRWRVKVRYTYEQESIFNQVEVRTIVYSKSRHSWVDVEDSPSLGYSCPSSN